MKDGPLMRQPGGSRNVSCIGGDILIVCQDSTPTSCSDRLVAVKAKTGSNPPMAGVLAFVRGTYRLCSILYQRNTEAITNLFEAVEVGRVTESVKDNQCTYPTPGGGVVTFPSP